MSEPSGDFSLTNAMIGFGAMIASVVTSAVVGTWTAARYLAGVEDRMRHYADDKAAALEIKVEADRRETKDDTRRQFDEIGALITRHETRTIETAQRQEAKIDDMREKLNLVLVRVEAQRSQRRSTDD